MFQYRDAARAYLEARDLAQASGDHETLAALCLNLSSLYFQMGDLEASTQAARQGLTALAGSPAAFQSQLLIQLALIEQKRRNLPAATQMLRDAVRQARKDLDPVTEAQAWNELGEVWIDAGHSRAAEHALLEAFRLRKLNRDPSICYTYESLGKLRMLEHAPGQAAVFFRRAVDSARKVSPAALWEAHFELAKALRADGKPVEAFQELHAALSWLRQWRAEVLPADAFRVTSDVNLHDVYTAVVDLGSRLYLKTHQRRFAQEAFAAAEEGRAASLRALWAGAEAQRAALPPKYWETLSRLHGAEIALLENESEDGESALRRLRVALTEIEARAGVLSSERLEDPGAGSGTLLERVGRSLRPDEVYLGFHLGDDESWLYLVGREAFEVRALPPRAVVEAAAARFAQAVSQDSTDAALLGRELYGQFFGGCSRRLLEKPLWTLGLEGSLFDIPFAALCEPPGAASAGSQFLIEQHAVEVIPGILSLLEPAPARSRGPFVGVGDPIYNAIDPRLGRGSIRHSPRRNGPARPLELPRLVGSEQEIDACARIWRSHRFPTILLSGAAASRTNLARALSQDPAVLHFATHVLVSGEGSATGMVALSMQPGGELEFLTASDIGSWRANLGLVVMNGCSSAAGQVLPGAGLMGLTRAWLAAGAQAVIAARWPVADANEAFFESFYEDLNAYMERPHAVAQSLRHAQLIALRGKQPKSNPAFWSGYLCLARR